MRDLQLDVFLELGRHVMNTTWNRRMHMLIFNAARPADKGRQPYLTKIAVFVRGGLCQAPDIFSLRATEGRSERTIASLINQLSR